MTSLEIISRLCDVTNSLSDIVKKQQEVIERSKVEEEVKEELRRMVADADREQDVIEYNMRKICDTDDIEANMANVYDVEVTATMSMEIEAMSESEAEEKARREYVDFTHISPITAHARKRGE